MSSMQGVVLDTDVVSYLYRKDALWLELLRELPTNLAFVSFMTVAELRFGASWRGWGTSRREELEHILDDFLIIHSSDALIHRWAAICAHGRRIGRPVGHGDAWIAATALELGFPLLTNNRRHYEDIPHLQLLPTPS